MKNNNEQFLLELLNMSSGVYVNENEEYIYFYPSNPKSLGFTIQIPFSQGSTSIDINFIIEDKKDKHNKMVNFSIDSIDEVKNFMNLLYKKHDTDILNNRDIPDYIIEKIENALKAPLHDNYPYVITGQDENMVLKDKMLNSNMPTNTDGLHINIGRSLYNYENKKKFKPLQPIIVDCFYNDSTTDGNIMYKKVIPAYQVHEYPIIEKHAHIHSTTKDIMSLIEAVDNIKPEAGSALNYLVLDMELDNNTDAKSMRRKI